MTLDQAAELLLEVRASRRRGKRWVRERTGRGDAQALDELIAEIATRWTQDQLEEAVIRLSAARARREAEGLTQPAAVVLWLHPRETHADWLAMSMGEGTWSEVADRVNAARDMLEEEGYHVIVIDAAPREVAHEIERLGVAPDSAGRAAAIGSLAAARSE